MNPNLTKALYEFQKNIGKVVKDKDVKSSKFSFKYATLSQLQDAIREPLHDAGLVFMQKITSDGLETCVAHAESGESDCFITPIACSATNNAQAFGSAVTYARRYALGSYFNLIIDDDDDGAKASAPASGKEKLHPKHKRWDGAVKALRAGTIELSVITDKFEVSEEDLKVLEAICENVPA